MGINLIHESGLVHALLSVILTLFYLELRLNWQFFSIISYKWRKVSKIKPSFIRCLGIFGFLIYFIVCGKSVV